MPVTPDKLGDCKTDGSKIRLGSQDTRVFFHELSHAIHARIDGELKGGQQINHHRKLAIIDRKTLWEGSLNILSQSNSREIMRRTEGGNYAQEMFDFLKLGRFI